ncbi:hypothetical protein [Mesorhizobium sp. Z1-4]|uniref:hypothetical protein n=1 Tax=Mesorhizobium sp. Z1-4 TaxID=2448478 RepID=UPI000FDA366C|nr:hypothetical protein [Mesorhizobium sp. Z1-4]
MTMGKLVLDLSTVNADLRELSLPPIDLDVFAERLSGRLFDLGLAVSKKGFTNNGDSANLPSAPGAGDYVIVLGRIVGIDEFVTPTFDTGYTGEV